MMGMFFEKQNKQNLIATLRWTEDSRVDRLRHRYNTPAAHAWQPAVGAKTRVNRRSTLRCKTHVRLIGFVFRAYSTAYGLAAMQT